MNIPKRQNLLKFSDRLERMKIVNNIWTKSKGVKVLNPTIGLLRNLKSVKLSHLMVIFIHTKSLLRQIHFFIKSTLVSERFLAYSLGWFPTP